MAVLEGGTSAVVAEVGAVSAKGLHVITKPIDHGVLGHYRIAPSTGILGATLAANAQLLQFKWTDATRLAVITYIEARFQTLTKFTAATLTDYGSLDGIVIRPTYTGGGGGTALTMTGNNAKVRTSMGTSLVGEIRVATTGLLTAVSATLDTQPFCSWTMTGSTATSSATVEQGNSQGGIMYDADNGGGGSHPLVLAQNEGFIIRNRTVWPAAGTGMYSFTVHWAEVTAF